MSKPENFTVPFELMNRLYNTLMYYANRTSYEAPRTGGVLAGCPRGKVPTPEELTHGARWAIREIDRTLLPHNKPTNYWPLSPEERTEFAAFERKVRDWLKESPMSERISARRCRELIAILDACTGDSRAKD